MTPVGSPLRVVQWSTGTIGVRALRAVIEHPELELAGVHVHGADKVGRDAGALCDMPDTGITATDSVDAVVGTRADCVLYMPNAPDVDTLATLLSSGMNVVTTAGMFHHPPSVEPAIGQRIRDACSQGATTIHSTGSSPGFISEAVPLVLTSIQRRLDHVAIEEYADLSRRPSPELLFDLMGFGQPMAEFQQFRADYLAGSFGPSLRLIGDALGLPLDTVDASGELAATGRDVDIVAGTLHAGTVAAQRITVTGRRSGVRLLTFRATWYCTEHVEADWELRDTGWRVSVAGDAPLEVDLRMPIPLERMADVSPAYTANRAVNAVPYVCAAPPGIASSIDLPSFVPTL